MVKRAKRSKGRAVVKVKRAAKAVRKAKVKAKRKALAPRMRRPLSIQAQAVGSLVVSTALDVAEAIGDVPVEQVAMDCDSGLAPDEELAQLDALDDADRRDDERADLPDPATDIY